MFHLLLTMHVMHNASVCCMYIMKIRKVEKPDDFYCLEGRKIFAKIIDAWFDDLKKQGFSQTRVCNEIGITQGAAKEMRNAVERPFTLSTWAKLDGKIPKARGGYYSKEEILAILCCWEEPPKVKHQSKPELSNKPYAEAIAILEEATKGWDAVELRDCLPEIDDWMEGERPDHRDITLISVVLNLKHRKADLYRIYGHSMEAMDPQEEPDSVQNQANSKASNGNGRGKKANRR